MSLRRSTLVSWISLLALTAAPAAVHAADATHHHRHHRHKHVAHAAHLAASHKTAHHHRHHHYAMYDGPRGGHVTRVSMRERFDEYSPDLRSSSALIFDEASGQTVYAKNAHNVEPIASVSKLMTAMVVLDMHLPMDEPITITEDDVDHLRNSASRLLVGTTLTRGEMLHLALMASENRAAHALARTAPCGEAAFIGHMNEKARSLGMDNTHFEDPTGLTSHNVSTAEDLVRLVEAAHGYATIREDTTSHSYTFVSNVNRRTYEFHNTDPLVKSDNWDIGLSKTGFINEAGKCLVMQANIDHSPIVIVLLDSVGRLTRIADANRVKRWLETSPAAKLRAG